MLNKIYLKFVLRSRLNIWLGKKIYKNSGGLISNLIGRYVSNRDIKKSKLNGFNSSKNTDSDILRKEGFLLTKNIDNKKHIKAISIKWNDFADKAVFPNDGRLQLSSADNNNDSRQFIPYLKPLITNDIKNILESYFQSYMRIINFHIYRTRKPEAIAESDLFGGTSGWHTDGSTTESIKLFFMLSDITSSNGPMQILSIEDSQKVISSNNFRFPDINGTTNSFITENFEQVSLEGEAGTAFFACTNDSLHRATTPNNRMVRDLITFYITTSSVERSISHQLEEANYREVIGFKRLLIS